MEARETPNGRLPNRIAWLSWKVCEDNHLVAHVVSDRGGQRVRERLDFPSLQQAVVHFGPGFGSVVERCIEAGSRRGRWRP